MKNLAWCVLALFLVTACSSGGDSSADERKPTSSAQSAQSAQSPGVPTPTSDVTVPPADPAWSEEDSAAGYRAAIRTVTDELARLSRMSPTAGLATTRRALRAYAAASTATVEELLKGKWDDGARPAVNTLIAALLEQQKYFDALANGTSTASIRAQSDQTAQTLLITRYWSAELEKRLGVSEGLLDPSSPGGGS